jgi:photosystem II stability/assembly factor-like uncharacterized protein
MQRYRGGARILVLLLLSARIALAQFAIQDSQSSADFRGVHAVSDAVAWVSGTDGTVLRTEDGGAHWQKCATPPDADKLDFRGIWASDAQHAQVMSAGPGELSRLFATTDGCQSWNELKRNHEKDGFWDSFAYARSGSSAGKFGVLIGDPIKGRFDTMVDSGGGWAVEKNSCEAQPNEAAFAASNSSVFVFGPGEYLIVSGGKDGPRALAPFLGKNRTGCGAVPLPLATGEQSTGAFSVYFRDRRHGVVVGGDYKKPNESAGTAAFTSDGGRQWTASSKQPHGYRSAVIWNANAKAWIAVGTNGADISTDDGKTWRPLDNENWNAVSLPFAVGPKGRIGKLKRTEGPK